MSSATLTNFAPRSTALRLSYQKCLLASTPRHMVIQIGCAGEGQVSDRLQKNFGERLKCGEHRFLAARIPESGSSGGIWEPTKAATVQ
jgi:hypothetical protein